MQQIIKKTQQMHHATTCQPVAGRVPEEKEDCNI